MQPCHQLLYTKYRALNDRLFATVILVNRERTLMGAKGLFGLGALAFWLPEIALYAWQRQALNAKLVTFLLPSTFLLAYLLVSILRPRRIPKPSAAIFMVSGVVFLGTLAMTIGATILGTGFRGDAVSTLPSPRNCYSNLCFHWCNV